MAKSQQLQQEASVHRTLIVYIVIYVDEVTVCMVSVVEIDVIAQLFCVGSVCSCLLLLTLMDYVRAKSCR